MKIPRYSRSLRIGLGLFAVFAIGVVPKASAKVITIAGEDGTAAAPWVEIKDDTYSQRAHFADGVARLSSMLDDQISVLKAKRATMTIDMKEWDFAMKEVDDSREYLTSKMSQLKQATTPGTWAAAKDKIGEAWKRSQLAVDKMNSTITS
ncbi:MAG: hypothetical protein WCA95_08060 [Opitutaceae bacterium]|jgi:hypothetical protein